MNYLFLTLSLIANVVLGTTTLILTWRARNANLRAQLAQRQSKILKELQEIHLRILGTCRLLVTERLTSGEKLRSELDQHIQNLVSCHEGAKLFLPNHELRNMNDFFVLALGFRFQDEKMDEELVKQRMDKLDEAFNQLRDQWRKLIGTDELTKQNRSSITDKFPDLYRLSLRRSDRD